ncbi:MAG: HAMP domain-containing protein [Treponema sp.]|nr:HAMP domain-containing protein [Treponema sp.]
MKLKDFFLKYHLIFFGLIAFFANFLAVLSSNLTTFPAPDDTAIEQWKFFLSQHPFIINFLSVICYSVPAILCIQYTLKPLKYKNDDKKNLKIRVHIPEAYAVRGITGWICNGILEILAMIYFKYHFGHDIFFIMFPSISNYCFLSIFAFTLIYFTLETLNRNVVLPHLFPEGKISEVERTSLSSIKRIFLFYFFSSTIFPVVYLGIRLFFSKKFHLVIPNYNDFIFTALLLITGMIMTLLMASYFQKPLAKLTEGAKEISKGNYEAKTVICSNDEMGLLGDTFNEMSQSLKEKEFMRDTFGKIVTPQVRDYLLNGNVTLGGETVNVTVMFCDIRGFTTLSENMTPEKIVTLLNEYFTGLEECITSNRGVINKYIGDAVMAVFGAPLHSETHAEDAFKASIAMREKLKEMNQSFLKKGLPEIHFGIGLHSGPVLAGNIGASRRMEYTVIGDTVNTASRIEGLCKTFQKDLLISESTASLIKTNPDSTDLAFVAESEIRGRKEKVKLYTAG